MLHMMTTHVTSWQRWHVIHATWAKMNWQEVSIPDYAPIVVCGNKERVLYNKLRAQQFARKNDTIVCSWPMTQPDSYNDDERDQSIRRILPDWSRFYYVADAPAVLTENIAVEKGLCNGTTGTFHALHFKNDKRAKDVRKIFKNPLHNAGDIVQIPVPTSVIVKTVINGEEVFVPTTLRSGEKAHCNDFQMYQSDLRFAVTFHKVQGQSLDCIVLDLNIRPNQKLTLQALYVGLTRLKNPENLYIICCTDPFSTIQTVLEKRAKTLHFPKELTEFINKMILQECDTKQTGATTKTRKRVREK